MARLARAGGLFFATVCLAVACDGGAPAIDAAAPAPSRAAQIALRIDVQPSVPASLTGLGYRAAYSGVSAREVLGLVDPLAGAVGPLAPGAQAQPQAIAQPINCQLRDLDRASTDLAAHGDAIELEELKGVSVSNAVGSDAGEPGRTELLRLSPRLFPDIAASIGGVVSEGGPVALPEFPQLLRVAEGGAPAAATVAGTMVAPPAPGWLKQLNGATPVTGATVSLASNLRLGLGVSGRADTKVEVRPLGATVVLTCAVPLAGGAPEAVAQGADSVDTTVEIAGALLAGLVQASGGAPGAPIAAALDVVRRVEQDLASSTTRLALEVRTSTLVELRP